MLRLTLLLVLLTVASHADRYNGRNNDDDDWSPHNGGSDNDHGDDHDDHGHDDDEHSGVNVLRPLLRLTPDNFTLWGDRSYCGYGFLDFPRPNNPGRFPAWMCVDYANYRFVLYHNTTYHNIQGDKGIIALRVPPTTCTAALLGQVAGDFCVFRTAVNMQEWEGNHTLGLRTDNDRFEVELDDGNAKVVSYIGDSVDHHVAPRLAGPSPNPTAQVRKAFIKLNKIADSRYRGFIHHWWWSQLFGGAANLQTFGVTFKTYKRNIGDASVIAAASSALGHVVSGSSPAFTSVFDYPSWIPNVAHETRPPYRW